MDAEHLTPTSDNCDQCDHERSPHLVLATGDNPLKGGIIICNIEGCMCYATWSVDQFYGKDEIRVPDNKELSHWRERFQQ